MNSFSSQHLNSKIYIDILGKILLPVMHSIHTTSELRLRSIEIFIFQMRIEAPPGRPLKVVT